MPKPYTSPTLYDDVQKINITKLKDWVESKWWNAPLNYATSGNKWGLILNKKDKSTIVQMYPIKYKISNSTVYLVKLHIWHYDTWMNLYSKEKFTQQKKVEQSGF